MVFLVSVSNCVFSRSRTICFTRRVVCKKKWMYVLAFFNVFSRSLICLHWGCALAELSVSIKSTLLIVIYSFLVSAAAYKQIFVHVNKSLCMSTSAIIHEKTTLINCIFSEISTDPSSSPRFKCKNIVFSICNLFNSLNLIIDIEEINLIKMF